MHIVSIIFALLVLMGSDPAVALTAYPAAPRCESCLRAQEIQQLDCNALAKMQQQHGTCEGFCQNFAQAWGAAAQRYVAQCISNCNAKLAQCAGGGGGGGGASQPNCQWYSEGNIRKRICRIY
jgi:hypothetical protein